MSDKAKDINDLSLDQLFDQLIDFGELKALIDCALREDFGDAGDITSKVSVDSDVRCNAVLRSREEGILAGGRLIEMVGKGYDESLEVSDLLDDGQRLGMGEAVAIISGPRQKLLSVERVMLNFVSHLSGIATLTGKYVDAAAGPGAKAKICDTRKTIPGYRGLAKYAVRCGGGFSHRMGLYDAVLIKDNHLAGLSGQGLVDMLKGATGRARELKPEPAFIEVEVDSLEQLKLVLGCDVDMVLLDNMTTDQLSQAVKIRDQENPAVELEASGCVNLQTVKAIAETGVDRISIGALTHSAPVLDMGLDIQG